MERDFIVIHGVPKESKPHEDCTQENLNDEDDDGEDKFVTDQPIEDETEYLQKSIR